jgi:hypothetical protein
LENTQTYRHTGCLATRIGNALIRRLAFFLNVFTPKALADDILLGYIPILLGCISMSLCWRAHKQARHKALVLCYAVLLAPLAFYYPFASALVWASYISGGSGPFPLPEAFH